MFAEQKCDVLCIQNAHQGQKAVRLRIGGMRLVAEIPHEQYRRPQLFPSYYNYMLFNLNITHKQWWDDPSSTEQYYGNKCLQTTK